MTDIFAVANTVSIYRQNRYVKCQYRYDANNIAVGWRCISDNFIYRNSSVCDVWSVLISTSTPVMTPYLVFHFFELGLGSHYRQC